MRQSRDECFYEKVIKVKPTWRLSLFFSSDILTLMGLVFLLRVQKATRELDRT